MGRTAAIATALLMVVLTASAGVVAPAAGGSSASIADDPDAPGETAVADASALPTVPVENSTARLVVPDEKIERSGIASMRPDLGAALSGAGDDLDGRQRYLRTEIRFKDASSDEERRIVIDQTLIDLKDEAVAMRERQDRTTRRYANGTIDESELLRTLASIDRSARRMLETTRYVASYLESRRDWIGLLNRAYEVQAILETLKGPVREEVGRTLRGVGKTSHFSVKAGDNAIVLSTVDEEGTFLREAYLPDNRGEESAREIDRTWQALERSAEYYPWAENNTLGNPEAYGRVDVFVITRPHTQGETTAYLDAYSGDVFYETQQLDVDAMPLSTVKTVSEDGLRLVVQRPYPGGPVRVGVYDNSTGNPVNARVSVAGVEIGPTDANGFVRAAEPRSEYEIEVRTPRSSANVTVDPQGDG